MNRILIIIFLLFNCYLSVSAEESLTEKSYLVLNEAQKLMESNQYSEAVKKLKALQSQLADKPYDAAITAQALGYAYYGQNDFKNARDAFVKAINIAALPEDVNHELIFNLTKILVYLEDYKEAEKYLKKWLQNENKPSSDGRLLAASIYQKLGQYGEMSNHLKEAIRASKNPPLNWYQLLASAYIESKQYKQAASVLEIIIKREPSKKDLWLQLAAVYQLSGQNKKALAITELAYKNDYLNSYQILDLVNNYLYLEMPYKAANLMNGEIQSGRLNASKDNLKLLANSWLLAQEPEQAAEIFQKLLNNFNDLDARFQLGQIQHDLGQWNKVIETLSPYVTNKDVSMPGQAHLLLGIAAFELNQKENSLKAFHKASAFNETKDYANWWIEQLKDKQDGLDG